MKAELKGTGVVEAVQADVSNMKKEFDDIALPFIREHHEIFRYVYLVAMDTLFSQKATCMFCQCIMNCRYNTPMISSPVLPYIVVTNAVKHLISTSNLQLLSCPTASLMNENQLVRKLKQVGCTNRCRPKISLM